MPGKTGGTERGSLSLAGFDCVSAGTPRSHAEPTRRQGVHFQSALTAVSVNAAGEGADAHAARPPGASPYTIRRQSTLARKIGVMPRKQGKGHVRA